MGIVESSILILCLAVSIMVLVWHRALMDALIQALENFRGGPPRPMHPSPVNDRHLPARAARRATG